MKKYNNDTSNNWDILIEKIFTVISIAGIAWALLSVFVFRD